MKRLLYITTGLNSSGGVSRVLSVKTNQLIEDYGYEIHILNTNGDGSNLFYKFNKRAEIHSLDEVNWTLPKLLLYKKKLIDKIKIIDPDIIINCDNGLKGTLLPLLIRTKVPLIYEKHISDGVKGNTLFDSLKLQLSFLIFYLTRTFYKWVIVFRLTKKLKKYDNFKVIPNPLPFNRPDEIAALTSKVAIAVGRLSHDKAYDKLLKIWSHVVREHPDWILNIYGEGDATNLKRMAEKLGIQSKVNFFSPIENIKDIYLSASCLINTSMYESFGLVLIEAMACGLPVFAFKSAIGPRIYIKNGYNGFLVDTDTIHGYSNVVINWLNSPEKMHEIGNTARNSIDTYQRENIVKMWHQLFQSSI